MYTYLMFNRLIVYWYVLYIHTYIFRIHNCIYNSSYTLYGYLDFLQCHEIQLASDVIV